MLYSLGEISGVHIFIHGTKIESATKRYTFVWKKAVTKHQKRLCQKIAVFVEECADCKGCPYKTQCIRGNNSKTPMEDRVKRLYVSKIMKEH